jgi:WD40 repeat protein
LRERLDRAGFSLWQDRASMEGGKDWWDQIDEALKHVEYMVLVMMRAAATSEIVRKEWRLARQRGVWVIPVFGVQGLNLEGLPRWMRETHFVDTENPEQWTRFLRTLEAPCRAARVPFMADDLPKDFVPRPAEFEALAGMLLKERKDQPVALTAALKGAGGYGKTTLAVALCHDERIGEEFHDGILWVTLGREPGEATAKAADLVETLTGERPGLKDADAAASKLAEVLADRDLLLVIDDVWNAADAHPFLRGGSRCVRLLTTRNADTLPPECRNVNLDAMRQKEAVSLLGYGLPGGLPSELSALAARLCEWPLLLKLVNGVLRKRVHEARQPLEGALRYVNAALDQRGLVAFDAREPKERNQAAGMTLDLSLSLLAPGEPERTGELAVFPEDADIPISIIGALWQATGGLDELAAEELCVRLHDLSLAASLDLGRRVLRLHDVVREVLRSRGKGELAKWNAALLDAYGPGHWWELPRTEQYLWRNLAYHLVEAGRREELKGLVFDFRWLAAKLEATDLDAVLADSGNLPGNEAAVLVNQALRLSAHVVAGDSRQLAGQITGRLLPVPEVAEVGGLLGSAAESARRPWLKPLWAALTPPGTGLVRTLAGHSGPAWAVAFSPDGRRAVSACDDRTLKVWDLETGRELRTLAGHSSFVSGVAVSPDGRRAVSTSDDHTLKVWDLETGRELRTLAGHSGGVNGVAVSPDGRRAVSASDDHTLKVWDLETGRELRTLAGHSGGVNGVAVSPDGRWAVSASRDQTLKVWDLETWNELRTLAGHSGWVSGVAVSPHGRRAVSASHDETLKVWDLETGSELRTLAGHSSGVLAVAVSPDGRRAVSASRDQTLKVWDLETGEELCTLAGHSGWVNGVTVSPDGRPAVSASSDQTLKVWDLETGREFPTVAGHSGGVLGVAVSPDGRRAVSTSSDWTLESLGPGNRGCDCHLHVRRGRALLHLCRRPHHRCRRRARPFAAAATHRVAPPPTGART